jgi:hypothetical protein
MARPAAAPAQPAHPPRQPPPDYGVHVVRRAAALALLVTLTATPSALADGDPASDFLAASSTRVFMTFTASGPSLQQKLDATTRQIAAAGLSMKVAIIATRNDLGAVPQLWGKPQTYAQFLDAELHLRFRGTLLVVMPQGFGISGPYPRAKARAVLSTIDPGRHPGPPGLTDAADTALRALAAADGHSVQGRDGHTLALALILAGTLVLVGIAAGSLARATRRRRREPHAHSDR